MSALLILPNLIFCATPFAQVTWHTIHKMFSGYASIIFGSYHEQTTMAREINEASSEWKLLHIGS